MNASTWAQAANLAIPILLATCGGAAWAGEEVADSNAASCVGRVCRVEGVVANISISKNNKIVLAFGKPYPKQSFSAVIDANSSSQFQDIQAYEGRKARVTGLVTLNKGHPEAALIHPSQLSSLQ